MKELIVKITGNVKATSDTWNEHAFRTEGVKTPPYSSLKPPNNLTKNAAALAANTRQQRLAHKQNL